MDWSRGFQVFSSATHDGLWLDEGVEELRLEKTVTSPQKTQEEIDKLTLDENMPPVERAVVLLKGQPLQQICALNNLPQLVRTHNKDCLYKVVPVVCTVVKAAPVEVQGHAAMSFATILHSDAIQPHTFTSTLLPTLLAQLKSKTPDVASAWLETGLQAVERLPRDVVKREFLPLTASMGHLSQGVESRLLACKLCGALVGRFEPFWTKKELWPLVQALCQDVDQSVRSTIAHELHRVAATLGMELSRVCILPEVTQLLEDEEAQVRMAGLEALVGIIPHLDTGAHKTMVLPLFTKICKSSLAKKDCLLPTIARLFGQAMHSLKDILKEEESLWSLDFYKELCLMDSLAKTGSESTISVTLELDNNDMDCRRWCAYNAPAMTLLCPTKHYDGHLHSSIARLAGDPSPLVRRQFATGFHEIVNVLKSAPPAVRMKMTNICQQLLKDPAEEVVEALLPHLGQVLRHSGAMVGLSPDTKQPGLADFIGPLLACEKLVSSVRQWRLQQCFLEQLAVLPHVMTGEQVYNKFVPVMFRYINGNVVRPVKLAAVNTLLVYLKHFRKAEHRESVCARLVTECTRSPKYKTRLLFLEVCECILERFSRNFFKQFFFEHILQVATDHTVNVRMRFYAMLPNLKRCLKLPRDHALLQKLEATVRLVISSELDTEASAILREAVEELDQVNVSMEVYCRQTFFENDIIDQHKEDEEREYWQEEELTNELVKKQDSSDEKLQASSLLRLHASAKNPPKKLPITSSARKGCSPDIPRKSSSGSSASSTPPASFKFGASKAVSGKRSGGSSPLVTATDPDSPSIGASKSSTALIRMSATRTASYSPPSAPKSHQAPGSARGTRTGNSPKVASSVAKDNTTNSVKKKTTGTRVAKK